MILPTDDGFLRIRGTLRPARHPPGNRARGSQNVAPYLMAEVGTVMATPFADIASTA